jgi:hypothetical protein
MDCHPWVMMDQPHDSDLMEQMMTAISQLPPRQRKAFCLGNFSSLNHEGLAALQMLALAGAMFWVACGYENKARGDEIQTVQIQVSALRMLHDLQATPDQIRAVQKLAADTSAPPKSLDAPDSHATTAPSYSKALQGLHDALLSDDDAKIESAEDAVDDLADKHDIDSDPDIESTEPARTKANDALKLFSAGQIANYIAANSDDFSDPTQTLLDALQQCRGGPADDFTSLRDDTAQEIARLIAGAAPKRARPIAKSVGDLLNKARELSDADFASQRADLEKQARDITAAADPVDVLRHWLHFQMADLLSNPELGQVLTEKLNHVEHGH